MYNKAYFSKQNGKCIDYMGCFGEIQISALRTNKNLTATSKWQKCEHLLHVFWKNYIRRIGQAQEPQALFNIFYFEGCKNNKQECTANIPNINR